MNGQGPSSSSSTVRYVVRSSDVLEDMRINVYEEGSDRVVWYKERFLTDDEILEHVVENATSTLLWTVHRPKRGWYLRLRAPSFPPGVFVPLSPLPQTSPYYAEAALAFACRTRPLVPSVLIPGASPSRTALTQHPTDSETTLTDGDTGSSAAATAPAPVRTHSYPPTPPVGPVVLVSPPSPRSVHAKLDSVSLSPPRRLSRPPSSSTASAITHFIVSPHAPPSPAAPAAAPSLFSRLVSAIRSSAPAHGYSFALAPLPGPPLPATSSSPTPTPSLTDPAEGTHAQTQAQAHPPLLAFHDQTPVWTARCSSGLLEMDEARCAALGVAPAFYVAVALTYLEFLEDRESYMVAAYD